VPVVLSTQVMYATSLTMVADIIGVPTNNDTGLSVMRFREPASGPITGYLIDDNGTPTLVLALELYLDDHDLSLPLSASHDLHSKPLSVLLRGPMQFLPDGRIALALVNVAELPITVNISLGLKLGSIKMLIPRGEMKVQLVSPPLRGGLP